MGGVKSQIGELLVENLSRGFGANISESDTTPPISSPLSPSPSPQERAEWSGAARRAYQPWKAPAGTSNGIMKAFDKIADQCRANPLLLDRAGSGLRARFMALVSKYRVDQCHSMLQLGTDEECDKRDGLLEDIIAQMDTWKHRRERAKQQRSPELQSIENAEELLRSPALEEVEVDEDASSTSDDDDVRRGAGSENGFA
ncbi:hypothetical protein FI667_g8374, partial [Globisporangium splendens]